MPYYQPSTSDIHRVCRMVQLTITGDSMVYVSDLLADAQELIDNYQLLESVSQIRRYLAAHFYLLENEQEKAGSEDGFNYTLNTAPLGKGLEATRFGQQAIALSDKLKQLNQLTKQTTTQTIKQAVFMAM